MANANGAAYSDVQTPGSHVDPDVSLQNYTYEKLLEYWTMVYTLGLLAEVVGTPAEQQAAQQAVRSVLENAAAEAMGFLDAAAVAIDDYTPPGVGAGAMTVQRGGLWAVQNIGRYFGQDPGFDADIENLDRRIRDSVAVDVNQLSQASRYGKAALEGLTQNTILPDYTADTAGENAAIAATQSTVDQRNAQVRSAIDRIWGALKDAALQRYNQFIADWDRGGLSYAIGTLGIDAAFLAVETAIIVVAGALTGGSAAVALKIAVTVGMKVGRTARRIIVAFKRSGGNGGRTGEFDVNEGSVVDHAKAKNGFGDDHAGVPRSGHDNTKDSGGPVAAGSSRLTRGQNDNEITYDPATGRPINAKGTLREDFGSSPRGDNATAVGKLGTTGDQGGHLVGHRFMGDTPDHGIAPQAGNLNQGAWKTMENEWADWIKKGYEVDYNIDVYPPGAVRPDLFEVQYQVKDPVTGRTVYQNSPEFNNQAGEQFSRIPFREME